MQSSQDVAALFTLLQLEIIKVATLVVIVPLHFYGAVSFGFYKQITRFFVSGP
jgi:hypothetical protein